MRKKEERGGEREEEESKCKKKSRTFSALLFSLLAVFSPRTISRFECDLLRNELDERENLCAADWAFVALVAENVGAVAADAHVAARHHNGVCKEREKRAAN